MLVDSKIIFAMVGLFATVVVQIVGIAWWASNTSGRVGYLEKTMESRANVSERLTRLETVFEVRIDSVSKNIQELQQKVDKLGDK